MATNEKTTNVTLPSIPDVAKPTPRKNGNANKPLSIDAAIEKAGIIIDKSPDAAAIARENLRKSGAEWVPATSYSDNVVILSDTIRANLSAADNGIKNACLLLAVIDETQEYQNALNAKGKPYTSTLELARDLFPHLKRSTVSNYITDGRSVYLPAARGLYGKASAALLAQSPSNATIFAGYVSDKDKRKATKALNAIQAAYDSGNGKITAKVARDLAKELKAMDDPETANGAVSNSDRSMTKARAEYNVMEQADAYNQILKKMLEYVPQALKYKTDGDITVTIPHQHVDAFNQLIADAIVSDNADDKNRVLKALRKVITG